MTNKLIERKKENYKVTVQKRARKERKRNIKQAEQIKSKHRWWSQTQYVTNYIKCKWTKCAHKNHIDC